MRAAVAREYGGAALVLLFSVASSAGNSSPIYSPWCITVLKLLLAAKVSKALAKGSAVNWMECMV
jgi:hypothetical protein